MKETIPQCTCTSKYYNEHAFKFFKYIFKGPLFILLPTSYVIHIFQQTTHMPKGMSFIIIFIFKSRLMNQQKTKMQLRKLQSKRGMIVCIFKSSTCLRQEDYHEYEATLD